MTDRCGGGVLVSCHPGPDRRRRIAAETWEEVPDGGLLLADGDAVELRAFPA